MHTTPAYSEVSGRHVSVRAGRLDRSRYLTNASVFAAERQAGNHPRAPPPSDRSCSSVSPSSIAGCLHELRAMEVGGASMAMQSRAHGVGVVGAGGRRSAFLGREKQARPGSLRVGGGTAGAVGVAVRARGGTRPVAPLCCVRASRGERPLFPCQVDGNSGIGSMVPLSVQVRIQCDLGGGHASGI